MIIPKVDKLNKEQLAQIEKIASDFKCTIQEINGANRSVYAILGDEGHELMFNRLNGLDFVDRVDHIDSSYKLLDVRSSLANNEYKLGGVLLGSEPLFIAGHCTVDPKEPNLYLETACALKEIGVHALRGGVWKPRTMPYSYQGDSKAIDILLEAREKTGLPLNVEVMDSEQLEIALEHNIDILQVGTRNALNYSLLKEIGAKTSQSQQFILLKRGRHMAPINEFIAAAEYIAAAGNANVMLCPRGTTPGMEGYRNHPDESITPLLKEKTWAPVVVDPSHSVGHSQYVGACSMASIAYGADGLCIESHLQPSLGLGDDPCQAVTPEELAKIMKSCREVWAARI